MLTNIELEKLLQNLIVRVNRIEANVADMKPVITVDPAADAAEVAIIGLDRCASEIEARRLKLIAQNARWLAAKGKRRGK